MCVFMIIMFGSIQSLISTQSSVLAVRTCHFKTSWQWMLETHFHACGWMGYTLAFCQPKSTHTSQMVTLWRIKEKNFGLFFKASGLLNAKCWSFLGNWNWLNARIFVEIVFPPMSLQLLWWEFWHLACYCDLRFITNQWQHLFRSKFNATCLIHCQIQASLLKNFAQQSISKSDNWKDGHWCGPTNCDIAVLVLAS